MYTPSHFREDRPEIQREFMRAHPLATLVTHSPAGLDANHIPVLVDDAVTLIRGHIARANPVWREAGTEEALAIFTGEQYYVSPSWYPSKQEHGKVVPTWNYQTVHAHGTLTFFEDKAKLRDLVDELTRANESKFPQPWGISDAPPEYIDGLLSAIVGFELRITRLVAKFKQSQNRPEADRAGVAAARSIRLGMQVSEG
jgi:transcriptional regulator